METLVLETQHRNHYYRRSKTHFPNRFGCSPNRGFKDLNCRNFQSGAGILPTPFKSCKGSSSLNINKKTCSSPTNHISVSPCNKNEIHLKYNGKSSPIPINRKPVNKEKSFDEGFSDSKLWAGPAYSNSADKEKSFDGGFSDSKLWAGPAYSNSPPPSSLPIPKFTLHQRRSVSLEFPVVEVKVQQIAKSAPPSPTREPLVSPSNFFLSTASATKDLRRILHLDIDDE